ncbi:putative tyrosine-protein phosphatase 10D-like [Apostichopus japonicus]|uniref:protein-tyrosine-phosphatase n=1 Tax=Stichopus japonicus TaxID=307972 RepID=A0A2G8KGW8_STIJA|nr:putative tyrosine-protein phosphatase 10D-like [Apostichopus japonicus]
MWGPGIKFEVSINVVSYNERTITISWGGGVGDFDRYQITYSPETGSTQSPLIIERFGQRTLVFEDLTPGELYTITIQLLKGSLRKEGMRTVTQRTRPEQVRGLMIQDVNSQSIQVSWEDAGGSFDSYVVTLDPMDGFPASPFLRVPGETQVTFNNLVIATRYEATVITRSGNEDSLVSRANGLTTPTRPTLRVEETTSDQIAISWSPPAGYIPSRYQLSWNATTSFVDLINITDVDVRRRDITGLIPATRYDINLRAVVDRSGTTASSPPSVAIGVTDNGQIHGQRPSIATLYSFEVISQFQNLVSNRVSMEIRTVIEGPSNLEITNVDSTSISFRWVEATGQRDSYLVSASYSNINNSIVAAIDGNSHTFDNLPPYTTIDISVQTVFVQDGIEIRSNPLTRSQRTSGDIPGPVRNVNAMQVLTDTKIAIEFEIPDMVNGDLEEFIVTYTESRDNAVLSTTTSTIMVVSTAVVFYTKSFTNNVNRGSSYVFSITARNNFGDGPSVDTNMVVINNIAVVSEAPTENQLTVTFDRNLVSTDAGDIQEYTVIIAERGPFAPRPWPTSGNIQVVLGEDDICGSFTYCNPPLKEGTTYLVAIRVYNDVGYRTSDFMEFTTSESFFSQYQIYFIVGGIGVVAILIIVLALCLVCCVVRKNKSGHDLKPHRRKRVASSVSSSDSGDGLDNINFNNAVTMIYNPAERASSGPSIASRFDNGAGVITRPVTIQNFASHVGKLSLNNQEGFEEEFESLHNFGLGQPSTAAVTTWNKSKNRFSNILPYDTSRVVLHGSDDFINASFIQGFHRPHEFIATQGPMEHTVNDFWRMIWEQQVPIVVMICDIIEGGKAKCEEYWPPIGEPTAFGEIVVTTLSEKQTTKGREREFKLEIGEHSLSVSHYQFLEWPDKGVPTETASFMLFVKDIRSHIQTLSGPVVVHCSDGASRTGVFIALDIMMQALDNESDTLDVYGVVARLRKDRTNMVLSKTVMKRDTLLSLAGPEMFIAVSFVYCAVGIDRSSMY